MDEKDQKPADAEQVPATDKQAAGDTQPKRYKRPTIAQHGNLRMMTELE